MAIQKKVNGTWQPINPKQLKGIPYTGTLPAVLTGTKAGYLHRYKIYGNLSQNGTPTPENPIEPSECGERTVNLCDENNINQGYYAYADGQYSYINTWVNTYYIAIKGNTEYTAKFKTIYNRSRWYGFVWYDSDKQYISTTNTQANPSECELTATSPANAAFCVFNICSMNVTNDLRPSDVIYCMLNEGSTALPYEPYGYKLPILSNSTVTNIYLGEAQTTRKIKKLVLTGEETIEIKPGNAKWYIPIADMKSPTSTSVIDWYCSHYQAVANNDTWTSYDYMISWSSADFGSSIGLRIRDINFLTVGTVDDFKSYLAAQYAAGTPVTVWYVLAKPETAVVNEPLMKIGEYVDTIDSTQTSVQIPTAAGETTISWAGEGLAPSEFDSIQEWVDIPTYTRVNGKWIANFETIIYGFHVDPSVADPANAVTYLLDAVGKTPATNSSSVVDYSDWADAFFMPKPCMLNYDGTVAYYLDPDDYSKKLDGSPSDVANPLFSGNAMMEWSIIWWKYEAGETEGEMSFYVSNRQVDSTYHCWCNIDAENHITDHFYTAIYNGTSATTYSDSATYAVDDLITYSSAEYRCTTAVETPEAFDSTKWEKVSDVTRLRSLSGKALTAANGNGSTTGTVEVQRATANNTTAAVEWYTDVFSDRQLINGLLTLVSKTLDSSAVYGRGLDSVSQSAKEAYVTGTLNDKGLFWGNPSAGTSAKKCFGMENWDGCVWHRTAGLIGSSSTGGYAYKLTYNTADGSTATSYNSTGSGYLVGATGDGTTIARPVNGYVTTMKVASATGIWLPGTVGGSTSTYYCDFYYNGTGYGLAGGSSNSDALCGCWFLNLSRAFGYATWYIAASPSCKPLASRLRLVEGGGS